MDLILWRCAETVKPDEPDHGDTLKAPLNERGRKRAERMARWIASQQPKGLKVYSSPAMATVQMARLVCRKSQIERRLGPDACAADVLGAIGWPHDHPAVLVIGHQPALGAIASLLLAGTEERWTIKKGAVWWFSNRSRAGETQTVLRAVLSPDMLRDTAADCIEATATRVESRAVARLPELLSPIEDVVMRRVLANA